MRKLRKCLVFMLTFLLLMGEGTVALAEGEPTLDEKLLAAEEITALPYSQNVNITSADAYIDGSATCYGRAYKVALEADDTLMISFSGNTDTRIQIYSQDGTGFTQLKDQDYDNMGNGGEIMTYVVQAAGTYYILPRTYSDSNAVLKLSVNTSEAENIRTVEEIIARADIVSEVPFEADFQMGAGIGYILQDSDYLYSVKAYKIPMEAEETVALTFTGEGRSYSPIVDVYNGDGSREMRYDNDNLDNGEMAVFTASASGNYVFLLMDECSLTTENYTCSIRKIEISSLETLLNAADTLTAPTYSETINLGQDAAVEADSSVNSYSYYGKAYKVALTDTQALSVTFAGISPGLDTIVAVYAKSGDTFSLVSVYDNDNWNDMGEKCLFAPDEEGVYYVVARGYEMGSGEAGLTMSVQEVSSGLDFTSDPVPVPGQDDLWSWDAATKTLLLKDGFRILTYNQPAIKLPDGAALVIEAGAAVEISSGSSSENYSDSNNAIRCVGSLAVEMQDGSVLNVQSSDDGIYTESDLEIAGQADASVRPVIKGLAGYDGDPLNAEYGDIILTDCDFDLTAGSDGLYAGENLTVTGCSLRIRSSDQGVDADNAYDDNGSAVFTDCTLDIESVTDQAIEADNLSLINCQSDLRAPEDDCIECNGEGNFICTGGTLAATGRDYVINSESCITLSEVKMYLESESDFVLRFSDSESEQQPLVVDGSFRLYDGTERIYQGELTDALYAGNSSLITEEGRCASKMVSFFAVTFYDDDGVTVLKDTQYIDYGSAAEAPADPVKPADDHYIYTFSGWDSSFDNVTGNLDIRATYKANSIAEPVVPTKPAVPDDTVDSAVPDISTSPQTGDDSVLWLFAGLMTLSAIAIVISGRRYVFKNK